MTSRGPGGRIPSDGRPSTAPGIGKNARRHDLEQPATPGLHGSDLQQGDVQALEQGQRLQPIKRTQPPAAVSHPGRSRGPNPPDLRSSTQGMQVPAPNEFLRNRLQGTLSGSFNPQPAQKVGTGTFAALIRKMATAPGAGGLMMNALLSNLEQSVNSPNPTMSIVDLNDLDSRVENAFGI